METKQWTVISLGGSILVPQEIDSDFLKRFVAVISAQVAKGHSFAIITGGGKICRQYQNALKEVRAVTDTELDMLGIYATRFNAELVCLAFGALAEPAIFLDPTQIALSEKPILVGGGWKPGHSSDGSAVGLAKTIKASRLINLSNIDYVYTDDPRTNPTAEKIEKISWVDFRALLPKEWNPGLSTPFDPVAAGMAEAMGLTVAVLNGNNLENLEAYLEGKEFKGTVIA